MRCFFFKNLFLIVTITISIHTKCQTPYFGIGTAINASKIIFIGSSGKISNYKTHVNLSQNLATGIYAVNGFTAEFNFGNTNYSGVNEVLNHELSISQIQTSFMLGYLSPNHSHWGILSGVYYGKINNVISTLDGKSIWESTEQAFDKSDFGTSTKLFVNFKKDDSRLVFSPSLNVQIGLKNIENQDQSLKQTTRLNSFMLGLNIKYHIIK
jgi:hypothetical protein